MDKSLYVKRGHHLNDDGNYLDRITGEVLKNIFSDYIDLGYSPREISHVMHGALNELELWSVLDVRKSDK